MSGADLAPGALPKSTPRTQRREVEFDPRRAMRGGEWIRRILSVAIAAAAMPTAASEILHPVPSGQSVSLLEIREERNPEGGTLWRFRFVAPAIARTGSGIGFEQAAADMDHLCAEVAVPYLADAGREATRIVISLADQALEFGVPAPQATQFFEAYRHENGACLWEEF